MSIKKLFLAISCIFLNVHALENYEVLWNMHKNACTNPFELQTKGLAFSIISIAESANYLDHYLEYIKFKIVDPAIWQDFNFFYGNSKYPQKHILNRIDRTKTKVGYATLAKQLTDVTNNIPELERRQNIVKTLSSDENIGKIQETLDSFAKIEDIYQFIFDQQKVTETFLKVKANYFSLGSLKKFNRDSNVLEASRVLPLIRTLIQTYLLTKGIKFSVSTFKDYFSKHTFLLAKAVRQKGTMLALKSVWFEDTELNRNNSMMGILGVQAINDVIQLYSLLTFLYSSQVKNNDLKILNEYNSAILKVVNICKQLYTLISANPTLQIDLKYFKNISYVLNNPSERFKKLMHLSVSQNYLTFGKVLAGFKLALDCKKELALLAQAIGEIDMYLGLAKLVNENRINNRFCMVHYVDCKLPNIRIDESRNILLDSQVVVANSIQLGITENDGHNAILNGTNESGKSTFQKSVLISLLLAQTIGIAPANSMELRPFDKIKYYQNISDDILDGKSLFRKQAQEFNKLFTIDPNLVTYLSIDEPATGANARNCAALSFAAAKQLQKAPWYIATISTHYPLLMSLEKATNNYFKNYKLSNPESEKPYLLQEGISDQHREFDILKNEGLNQEILNDAINLIRNDEDLKIMPIRSKL